MKKRRSKKDDEPEEDDTESEEEEEQETEELNMPVIVELGDSQAVKTALDDSLVQMVAERGYQEDQGISNVKIILGLLASAFGLFGQFHEHLGFAKFPDDRHILGACVAGYMFCSSLLSVLAVVWEKNYIASLKGPILRENVYPFLKDGEEIPEWCSWIKACKVETELERYDTKFTVRYTIMTADDVWQEPYEEHNSILRFFNVEGLLLEDVYQKWGRDVLKNGAFKAKKKK